MGNKNSSCVASTDLTDGIYRRSGDSDKIDYSRSTNKVEIANISFCKRNVQRNLSVYSVISTRSSCNENWPILQLEACFLPIFPLRTATLENSYEFIKNISHGSFSEIYLVRKCLTCHILKLYSKHQIISGGSVDRTNAEVQILKACSHNPFIINLVENWQSKRYLYIVCDYYSNGDLFEFTQDNLPSLELSKLFVAQIAHALDFLHNAGIIHRDIKLENFFLDERYNLKLGDFDLAKWLPYGTRTRTMCGSYRYMAPEVRMQAQYGHAVDWWSLGVVTCRLLTDHYPHIEFKSNASIIEGKQCLEVHLSFPKEFEKLANDQKDLIHRLIEIDEGKRIKSLRGLQSIRYFFEYNMDDVKFLKVNGKDLLDIDRKRKIEQNEDIYKNFDIFV